MGAGCSFPVLNQQPPQPLDSVKQLGPRLLVEDPAQQDAKRTNIATQRRFFDSVAAAGGQFGEPLLLVRRCPEWSRSLHLCSVLANRSRRKSGPQLFEVSAGM